MNTKQIWQALTNNVFTLQQFNGVYSKDTLKEIKVKPTLIICNTDPSSKPGKHWVLFYCNKDNSIDFFDSLGKKPSHYGCEFTEFLQRFSNCYYIVNTTIQSKRSNLCGLYCLYYAYWKCSQKITMRKIIKNIITNKILLIKFINSKYFFCKKSNCNLLQKSFS